jgi:RNA polymerase sigma-70 factor (ECF subfamily)
MPDLAIPTAWHEHRRVALDVAYRLLGDVAAAEDAVQEAYLRLSREPLEEIRDVRAWLVVVVSRICLNELDSARARREAYVGPWLPDPLVQAAGAEPDPADRITLDESVRMALLVVLERLSPAERVAFVLHDVFQLSFDEIGRAVGRTPAACRQLASRARRRIEEEGEPRFAIDRDQERELAERFRDACEEGDLAALAELLDPEAVLHADSGGLVQAPRRPVTGRDTILKIVANSFRLFPDLRYEAVSVNGGPGLAARAPDGTLVTVLAFAVAGGRIREVDLAGNPERLAALSRPAPPPR